MDNALKFEKVPELPHDNYNKVSPELITLLTQRSEQRRKADPKFQKQGERIKQFVDRKARHSIALNEAKFKAEYMLDDDEADHAGDKKLEKDKKKKKYTERRGVGGGLLRRRGSPHRGRLPHPGLQGPGRQPREGSGQPVTTHRPFLAGDVFILNCMQGRTLESPAFLLPGP